jgi:hypothetical protein
MNYLSVIIAKALALTDFFLEQWVDVTIYTQASPNGCWEFDILNASVNPCGQEFLSNLTDVVEGVVALLPSILGGLFSFGSPADV